MVLLYIPPHILCEGFAQHYPGIDSVVQHYSYEQFKCDEWLRKNIFVTIEVCVYISEYSGQELLICDLKYSLIYGLSVLFGRVEDP